MGNTSPGSIFQPAILVYQMNISNYIGSLYQKPLPSTSLPIGGIDDQEKKDFRDDQLMIPQELVILLRDLVLIF